MDGEIIKTLCPSCGDLSVEEVTKRDGTKIKVCSECGWDSEMPDLFQDTITEEPIEL